MKSIAEATWKGVVGSLGSGSAFVIASIETLNPWIKLAGSVIGLLVALATLISICFDIVKKWRSRNSGER